MSQSQEDMASKQYSDPFALATQAHQQASPVTYPQPQSSNAEQQGRTRMGSGAGQGRKIFGYEIFVDNDVLGSLQPEREWLQRVRRAGEVESIRFNLDLNIPDLNGRNIQIYDRDMQKKYLSCKALLADIHHAFKRTRKDTFSVIIFVPEGMVSLLIGTKGYQINKIMKESHTTIVVNQPINRMTYRTVKIQGYHSDIAKACRIIYEILEDKSSIAYSIEKEPSQLDYSKARVKTKFILCASLLSSLLARKKTILRRLEQQTRCVVKFREETASRMLKREQELCVLLGRLDDVQAYLVMLINVIEMYYEEERKSHDYTFKMLIPSNYVTKLIGQKGYMIRDIIERSGGAQIKILSDRQSQRDARECIISINGTRQNKIDATCLILEQIQCFKNGGPILQSGKSINENLAQQFKNSLPLHKGEEFFEEVSGTPMTIKEQKQSQLHNLRLTSIKIQENDNVKEEGLISAEEGEEVGNVQIVKTPTEQPENPVSQPPKQPDPSEPKKQALVPGRDIKRKRSSSRHSESSSPSRSRKKSRRNGEGKGRSSSSSQYQQDREYVQVKVVVPRKLAQDHKQLKYIESLCRSEIAVRQQRVEGSSEAILSVRGTLKDNSQCIKLLQKRILRLSSSTTR